jgi:uncharacterized Zn finger protein (UPF0148 family)
MEIKCPDCGEPLEQRYYGWVCPYCGLMLNKNFERAKPEDFF